MFGLTFRHFFAISVLLLLNIIILGCVFLALFGRVKVF